MPPTIRTLRVVTILTAAGLLSGCGAVGNLAGALNPFDNRAEAAELAPAATVNRFLWAASFDVLNFLPVEQADPSTGVIVTGFGTPPGSVTAFRATVLISGAELDPRSLSVSLVSEDGAASSLTARAVEDAILTRAQRLFASGI